MLRIAKFEHRLAPDGPRAWAPEMTIWFGGCCLSCHNCTRPELQVAEGPLMNVPTILSRLDQFRGLFRCARLSGGEPLLQPWQDLTLLIESVVGVPGYCDMLIVETSGSIDIERFNSFRTVCASRKDIPKTRCCLSMSHKLPSSGMSARMVRGNDTRLYESDMVRLRIQTEEDLDAAIAYLYILNNNVKPPSVLFRSDKLNLWHAIERRLLSPDNTLDRLDLRLLPFTALGKGRNANVLSSSDNIKGGIGIG